MSPLTNHKVDVIIIGGGLAGLGLAYQMKSGSPELKIIVIEKRQFPLPRAIAKVGESTVEIGSRYLSHHLGLKEHLTKDHLKKFGIRMFFGKPDNDFSMQDELGASQVFGIPTYQIDRGDIENHLAKTIRSMGVTLYDNADITTFELGKNKHNVTFETNNVNSPEKIQFESPWLVDASGRRAFIKQKLNLAKTNDHNANAAWFRIDKRIEIDSWSNSDDWRSRCTPESRRWLSTNHLVGPGYWVWVIPLASGVTSIGIVMDDQTLHESGIESQETAMEWLHKHQKRCAEAIEGASFLDFVLLRDYSYDCKQLMSDDGWAITGEAGLFADPFYSPGSDFIAINNNFISELIQSNLKGEDTRFQRALYEKLYFSIYNNTLSLYVEQYGGFGDRQMMGLKLLWDYSYYWGVLSLLFFRNALTDLNLMRKLNPILQNAQDLNKEVQAIFRQRAKKRQALPNRGVFMDQYQIPCLQHFNQVLMSENIKNTEADLKNNISMLEKIAAHTKDMLSESANEQISSEERELLGNYREKILAEA
ncbi:MAG: tryptophan 7-halogenase [Agarilytica sp.]